MSGFILFDCFALFAFNEGFRPYTNSHSSTENEINAMSYAFQLHFDCLGVFKHRLIWKQIFKNLKDSTFGNFRL